MNRTITGLFITVAVLAGILGFLAYSTQDLGESITQSTNPCLELWNEINKSGKLTGQVAYSLTEHEFELFHGVFAENNCRQNLDWLPNNHRDYIRLHQMWG